MENKGRKKEKEDGTILKFVEDHQDDLKKNSATWPS